MLAHVLFCSSLLLASTSHAQVTPAETHELSRWEQTLERAVDAVVAIRVTAVRDFDTESAGNTVGTGFVVDAEQGLILTNRHMVHAGPVVAEAVFLDHEEVELHAVYRDPVHDFGFYRFDPEDVRFMELVALPLAPEEARVGKEIRVVGNDAGEKISILDGTLARLDRNAPHYGGNTYNDFNTFYLQAASNTSGGSSGSPVIDINGQVLGLNAGGRRTAASSFYLPLDRVVRAMELLQAGEPVSRGTIQTVFLYAPFDEVRRLGLSPEVEEEVRVAFPEGTGMLVVAETVPGGPAWERIEPGDVLLRVDGGLVTEFVALEARLDDHVGGAVELEVVRGGEVLAVELEVGDLHEITPDDYFETSRGILHDVSYQQARNHSVPVSGAYVSLPGYMLGNSGVPTAAVITAIDGEAVADSDELRRVMEAKAHGQRVRLRYFPIQDPRHEAETVITVDRLWFPSQHCVRDDATGLWPCTAAAEPPPLGSMEAATFTPLTASDKVARRLAGSLVMVDFDIPHPTAGVKDFNFVGTGLVVDAGRGLVVVDRDTVPVAIGDIVITFGGAVRIPGELVYLHPVHNLAVLHYDPGLLAGVEVQEARLQPDELEVDDRVWMVGLNHDYQVVSTSTRVERVEAVELGIAGTPRFRDANMQVVDVASPVGSLGGVLADRKGQVVALWSSFLDQRSDERQFHGLPAHYVLRILEPIQRDEPVDYRSLGAELVPITLAEARERGLSDARATALLEADPLRRKALEVLRVTGGTPAAELLRTGDLLLEVDGELVTRVGELERLSDQDQARVVVFRDGAELTLELGTAPFDGRGVDRIVGWAGLQLHESHYEVAAQQGIDPDGIYIAWLWYGSPAARYGLRPTRRIVEVDGVPTPDLDVFLAAVDDMQDRQAVRVKMVALDGRTLVKTMKLDLTYWPTLVLERDDGEWVRREL